MKTIRLLTQVRSGKSLVPKGAVVDATDAVADGLIGMGKAEETDAIERHPDPDRLNYVNEVDVTGTERFPLPEDDERRVDLG